MPEPGAGGPAEWDERLCGDLLRKGDSYSLTLLEARFGERFRARLLKRGLEAQDAKDVVQKVWLRLINYGKTYSSSKGSLEAWLWIITWRVAGASAGSQRRERAAIERLARQGSAVRPPSGTWDPAKRAAVADDIAWLRAALKRCAATKADRQILRGRCNGLDYAEIGGQIGISAGNARGRFHALAKKLRALKGGTDDHDQ